MSNTGEDESRDDPHTTLMAHTDAGLQMITQRKREAAASEDGRGLAKQLEEEQEGAEREAKRQKIDKEKQPQQQTNQDFGYLLSIIKATPQDLECSICSEMIYPADAAASDNRDCHHFFHGKCVNNLGACPLCRRKGKFASGWHLTAVLSEMCINCSNTGCKAKIYPWDSAHEESCEYRSADCPLCGIRIEGGIDGVDAHFRTCAKNPQVTTIEDTSPLVADQIRILKHNISQVWLIFQCSNEQVLATGRGLKIFTFDPLAKLKGKECRVIKLHYKDTGADMIIPIVPKTSKKEFESAPYFPLMFEQFSVVTICDAVASSNSSSSSSSASASAPSRRPLTAEDMVAIGRKIGVITELIDRPPLYSRVVIESDTRGKLLSYMFSNQQSGVVHIRYPDSEQIRRKYIQFLILRGGPINEADLDIVNDSETNCVTLLKKMFTEYEIRTREDNAASRVSTDSFHTR